MTLISLFMAERYIWRTVWRTPSAITNAAKWSCNYCMFIVYL